MNHSFPSVYLLSVTHFGSGCPLLPIVCLITHILYKKNRGALHKMSTMGQEMLATARGKLLWSKSWWAWWSTERNWLLIPLVIKDLGSFYVFMSLVCGYCYTHGSKLLFCPAPRNVTHKHDFLPMHRLCIAFFTPKLEHMQGFLNTPKKMVTIENSMEDNDKVVVVTFLDL